MSAAAKKIWAESIPIVGTLGETYLQSRGGALPSPALQCLRFAPKLQHPNQQYFPALLVGATEPQTGAPTGGIQRVFLAWSGKGKAQVERKGQKMSLGPMRGGVAGLAEPVDGKPLLLGEGVETVLTAMEATGLPGWATFGTSGIKNLALPDAVEWVILLAENDGGPNDRALAILIPALTRRGTKVDVAKPPVGLKDFNDLVNGTSGHTPHAELAVVKAAIEAAQAGDVAGKSAGAAGELDDEADGKFSLTKTGLYRRKNKKWEWIAQAFEVLGLARDAAADGASAAGWGKLLRFRNPDGATCEVVVSAASLHGDVGQLIGSLADQGMNIKCTMTARRQFVEYLASVEVERTGDDRALHRLDRNRGEARLRSARRNHRRWP